MSVEQVTCGEHTFDVHLGGDPADTPVVLLHGFPQSPHCYDAVLPRLHAAGLRTIVPAQRGYSPGARPTGVEDYRMPHLVGDVIALLDAMDVGWAHLVGHDWGAAVAWQVAARHPNRVSSLVVASVGHPVAFADALRNDSAQKESSSYMQLFAQPGKAEDLLLADDGRRLRAMVATGGQTAEQVAASVEPLLEPGALTAALSWYRAMRGEDYRECPAVEVATTYLWSTGDTSLGRTQAEASRRHVLADYRFVELPGVTHWIPEEAAAELAAEIVLRSSPW
ncbi:alpha/beta hydrolase [Rhodococcus sp. X156]|uniref:alpha/beta fold hydrolase n=1 Tax=Rhodococcus sp. X156 TaxID=2499145 RepID=UPI000FD80E36|nr:alpha/beta hydrolase [Rhodococcus sp. X156]